LIGRGQAPLENVSMSTLGGYRVIERATRDLLGEGPVWSVRRGVLFWVDILAPALRSLDLDSGVVSTWDMPEKIGWAIECANHDGFIIGLKSGFARLDIETMQIQRIGHPEPDRPHNRLNDAKVDRAGRIWAGTMDDREVEVLGALYRLDPGLTWSRHDEGYGVTNGPTFSPDGTTVYHTDSLQRTVFAFDLTDEGALTNKRLLLRFEDTWGYPDGMCTDADGGIWIAHWGGGRVSRFTADGRLDRSIALPASQITSCAFGGAGLDRMFVTSAAVRMENEPLAGALFEVESGTRGFAPALFAG
jgi:sugar lactone lactonase YvrE